MSGPRFLALLSSLLTAGALFAGAADAQTIIRTNTEDSPLRLGQPLSVQVSWIDVSDAPLDALVESLTVSWDVDADDFSGLLAILAYQNGDGEPGCILIVAEVQVNQTGDDENDLFKGTSRESLMMASIAEIELPPDCGLDGLPANGTWSFQLHDMEGNPVFNTRRGRIDSWTIVLHYRPPTYDLQATLARMPLARDWGESIAFTGSVRNAGDFGNLSSDFEQEFWLSRDAVWGNGDDLRLGSHPVLQDFMPGQERTFQVELTLPAAPPPSYEGPGPFYVGMRTDAADSVPETDEADNAPGALGLGIDHVPFTINGIMVDDAVVAEGDQGDVFAAFLVRLTNPLPQSTTVAYATGEERSGEVATAGVDFVSQENGRLEIPAFSTSGVVQVRILPDRFAEPDETFMLVLSPHDELPLHDAEAVGLIGNDDDPPPRLMVGDVSRPEGNGSVGHLRFPIFLQPVAEQPVTLSYRTRDGSTVGATQPTGAVETDFRHSAGTLTIEPGGGRSEIPVPVHGDTIPEPDETLYLLIDPVHNATIRHTRVVGRIENDDLPSVSIAEAAQATEPIAGEATLDLTVALSHPVSDPVTVFVVSEDGTARAGADYVALAERLTFYPGSPLEQSVTLRILTDAKKEDVEALSVSLLPPVNAVLDLDRQRGSVTISDRPPIAGLWPRFRPGGPESGPGKPDSSDRGKGPE